MKSHQYLIGSKIYSSKGRFTRVIFPPHQMPQFSEVYAPTEGRVINGGIKIRLE